MTEQRTIDLRAAREARGAAQKERVTLKVPDPANLDEDLTFSLPPELPLGFLELILTDQILEAFRALVGDRAEELRGALYFEDAEELADQIAEVYGIEGGLGNLSTSGSSRSNTSSP